MSSVHLSPIFYYLQSTENSIEKYRNYLFTGLYPFFLKHFIYPNQCNIFLSFIRNWHFIPFTIHTTQHIFFLSIFFAFFFNFLRILFDIVILLLILFYLAEFQSDLLAAWFPLCVKTESLRLYSSNTWWSRYEGDFRNLN